MLSTPVDADFSVETPAAGRTLLRLAAVPLELRAAETSRRVTRTSRYRALFKRADQNNNNYLEASEIPYLGPGLGSLDFAAMDRDHNGMVFEDEYIDYFRLRDALADGRLALTINVESIDPIAQFDTNHDGRLNRAEFNRVLEAIAKWDRNHDGFVTPEEIPRTLIGTFHMGPQRNSSMLPPAIRSHGRLETSAERKDRSGFKKWIGITTAKFRCASFSARYPCFDASIPTGTDGSTLAKPNPAKVTAAPFGAR